MFTLSYWNNGAAVVEEDGRYIHNFNSLEEARLAIAKATQIAVTRQPGNRTELIELTTAVKRLLQIILPKSFSVD